jgi:predicted glycosyltransferase involved in capsule biosynthesis
VHWTSNILFDNIFILNKTLFYPVVYINTGKKSFFLSILDHIFKHILLKGSITSDGSTTTDTMLTNYSNIFLRCTQKHLLLSTYKPVTYEISSYIGKSSVKIETFLRPLSQLTLQLIYLLDLFVRVQLGLQ